MSLTRMLETRHIARQDVPAISPMTRITSSWLTNPFLALGAVVCLLIPGVPDVQAQGLAQRPANLTCIAPERPQTLYEAEEVFAGLDISRPIFMAQPPGDSSRWFLVERAGVFTSFANDPNVNSQTTILDLTDRLQYTTSSDSQQYGVTGFALHPDFPTSPYIYVGMNIKNAPGENLFSTIARYESTDGGLTFDIGSEVIVLEHEQTAPWHHIGTVLFGPDGYLYVGMGENGLVEQNRAQDLHNLKGSVMRIDVNGGFPYAIPPDNPLIGTGYREEIYAWGLRNPWRFSFDSQTGDLWLGDVGPDRAEEINLIVNGGNYGWNNMIGNTCRYAGCDSSGFVPPVLEVDHSLVNAIIGGYVYRGSALPSLQGTYVFANGAGNTVRGMRFDQDDNAYQEPLFDAPIKTHSFAEDHSGELYLLQSYGGKVFKIVSSGAPPGAGDTIPTQLSLTGCFSPGDPTQPNAGVIPYRVNTRLWSDGADKKRWMALPDGTTVDLAADGDFEFPIGALLFKEFSFDGVPFETRMLVRHTDGAWGSYTYEWGADGSDAYLLPPDGKTKQLSNGQTWTYPSTTQCFACHTDAANIALGPELLQLNGDMYYPSSGITANQLETLEHIGYFSQSLPGDVETLDALAEVDDTSATLNERARSYMHSNCSNCHRPGTEVPTNWDARYHVFLGDMDVCDVPPEHGNLGAADPYLLAPGDSTNSVIPLRMLDTDSERMPPIGTRVVDPLGTALIQQWIDGLSDCTDPASVTTYETGDGFANWTLFDDDPPGATVTSVYDAELDSTVIELSGDGKNNGYELLLGNNSSQFIVQWSGKFDAAHTIIFTVQTTDGLRRLMYAPASENTFGPVNIEYGLGATLRDGNWHTITRNLVEDLHGAQPGVDIIAVESIRVRGSGFLDDISLIEAVAPVEPEDPEPIVFEDAEDESIARWAIIDDDPAGALIENLEDADLASRVIKFTGANKQNAYELGLGGNSELFYLAWSSRFPSVFTLQVVLETTGGLRRLKYLPVDVAPAASGINISHGLGESTANDRWHHFTRDLLADLQAESPELEIVSVNSLQVFGSGSIDNVQLLYTATPGHITDPEPPMQGTTVYEDGEDGSIERWTIVDDDPPGAVISNEVDGLSGSRVVQFAGDGKQNAYEMLLDNDSQFILDWSGRFDEAFTVQVRVDSDQGVFRLSYLPVENDTLGSGVNIKYGLGESARDGTWHNFTRDLALDLSNARPGAQLLRVVEFKVFGSGSVDDVALSSPPSTETLYEDGEDGTVDGWVVSDDDPPGAVISNVFDVERQSLVIDFAGDGKNNTYEFSLGNNDYQFLATWSSMFSAAFSVVFEVETSVGTRRLIYYQAETDGLGSGTGITFGLGSQSRDGTWRSYARDLQADLQRAQPGVQLLHVTSVKVNGSGRIDDIRLLSPLAGAMLENAEDGTTDGWAIVDDDPAGAVVANEFDAQLQSQVITLSGDGKNNTYELDFEDDQEHFGIQWKSKFDETFSIKIWLDTSAGSRRLIYLPSDTSNLGSGTAVQFGLGSFARDGQWHTFTRDLQEDLNLAQPGVEILRVRSYKLSGSGSLDNIRLF